MSESTPRVFSPSLHRASTRRRRRGRRGKGLLVLLLALLLTGYVLWTTRDAYPMARLIPRQQQFRVLVYDILDERGEIAASAVWQSLPESWGLVSLSERLNQDLGMPEWVLNNLVGSPCHVSGNDLRRFSDALFVTRMRRIGCLVEKLHRLAPGITRDPAGGLSLRWLEEAGLYYAVRGRVLVASPSRDALVRCLTLREEDATDRDELSGAVEAGGQENLRGTFVFGERESLQDSEAGPSSPLDELGNVFSALSFTASVGPSGAHVRSRGTLQPAWRARLVPLLSGASPRELRLPPDGAVMVSADFGKPASDVWRGIAELVDELRGGRPLWEEQVTLVAGDKEAATALAQFFAGLVGPTGPGIRLSWHGMDLSETVPVPEFAGTFDADPESIVAAFESLPSIPEQARPWDPLPRYDATATRAHLPMPGGAALEPTAAAYGNDALLVCTSRTLAEELLGKPAETGRVEAPGNLYVRVRPGACAEAVYDTGALLAENGLLEGHTPESWESAMAPWLERTARTDQLSVLLRHDAEEIGAEIELVCSATQPAAGG